MARWNRLVKTVKTRKEREKTGGKWARYSLKRVKEGANQGPTGSDVKDLPPESRQLLLAAEVGCMVVDALFREKHFSHFSLDEVRPNVLV